MADKGPDITVITLPNPAAEQTRRMSYDSLVNHLVASGYKVVRLQPSGHPPNAYPSLFSGIHRHRKTLVSLLRQLLPLMGMPALLYVPFPNHWLLALIARLLGFTLVYHLQDEQQTSRLQSLLWKHLYRRCARHLVYHSEAVKSCYPSLGVEHTVLGPILDRKGFSRLHSPENTKRAFPFTLLMVLDQTSPAAFERYFSLARSLPSMQFLLLSNAGTDYPPDLPSNLQYSSRPNSRKSYFKQAHLLLLLDDLALGCAHTDDILLEGLSYGLPVVAVGKLKQRQGLIQQHFNGFTFTADKLDLLRQQVLELSVHREAYFQLSAGAHRTAREQTAEAVIGRVAAALGLHRSDLNSAIRPTAG